jgi:DnaJ-class molecular chaperone
VAVPSLFGQFPYAQGKPHLLPDREQTTGEAGMSHDHRLTENHMDRGFYFNLPLCPDCRGHGRIAFGAMKWFVWRCNNSGKHYEIKEQTHFNVCPVCRGAGYVVVQNIEKQVCRVCNGKKWCRI